MAMSASERESKQRKLVEWAIRTDEQRTRAGLPTSKAAWGRLNGVTANTITQWSKDLADEIETKRAAFQAKVSGAGPVGLDVSEFPDEAPERPTAAPDPIAGMSNAELMAFILRKNLEGAARGEKAAEDWIRSNQAALKPLLDQINAESETDFADETDAELVALFVADFEDLCVAALRGRGWAVEPLA